MKVASVRELKNQMSKFLKHAQKEDVIVTSRGKPIALISGLSSDDLEDYALVSDGELKSRLEAGIKAADEGKLIAIENLIAKAEAELEAQNAAVRRDSQNHTEEHKIPKPLLPKR